MHFLCQRLAHAAGLFLLGVTSQAHSASAYDCFDAGDDGGYDLNFAVETYFADPTSWNTTDDYNTYGPMEDWCTKFVTRMDNLFSNINILNKTLNVNITAWDTSSVTRMDYMFHQAQAFNQDISSWDTSKVVDMEGMFLDAQAFNQDISGWNTSSVTTMYRMFWGASAFNQGISGWDTSSVTNMFGMFARAIAFNQDISSWDTPKVTSMEGMFAVASAFNQDISALNTSSVTSMEGMFYGASAFNQDVSGWNITKVINMIGMFQGASAFNQNLCAWKDDFPYDNAADVFSASGCTNPSTPLQSTKGPFCAGSAAECQAYYSKSGKRSTKVAKNAITSLQAQEMKSGGSLAYNFPLIGVGVSTSASLILAFGALV